MSQMSQMNKNATDYEELFGLNTMFIRSNHNTKTFPLINAFWSFDIKVGCHRSIMFLEILLFCIFI